MDPGTSGSGASTAGDNRGRRLPTTGRRRRGAGGYGNARPGTVNLSNPRAIFAGSPPRFEAYVVSRTSTRSQVDSAHSSNAGAVRETSGRREGGEERRGIRLRVAFSPPVHSCGHVQHMSELLREVDPRPLDSVQPAPDVQRLVDPCHRLTGFTGGVCEITQPVVGEAQVALVAGVAGLASHQLSPIGPVRRRAALAARV